MSRKSRRNKWRKQELQHVVKSVPTASSASTKTYHLEIDLELPNEPFRCYGKVAKVDEDLGIVIGWGVVCTEDGIDYFDKQGDHVEEDALVEAAADFMEHSRVAKEMHRGQSRGSIVFAFPLTKDISDSLEIQTRRTGLLIGMRPDADVLEKFRSGELRGFSIGGHRGEDVDVEEEAA